MTRMGHDRERAAMIYQHEARGADKSITDAIDDAEAAGSGRSTGRPGMHVAAQINRFGCNTDGHTGPPTAAQIGGSCALTFDQPQSLSVI